MVRLFALIFGIVYLLIGILGFVPGITTEAGILGLVPTNALKNIVHLLVGLLGIGAYFGGFSRLYAQVIGVVYILLAVLGIPFPDGFGLLPLGGILVVIHAISGLLGIYFGFFAPAGDRDHRTARV